MAQLQDFSDFDGFFGTDWELHVLVMFLTGMTTSI